MKIFINIFSLKAFSALICLLFLAGLTVPAEAQNVPQVRSEMLVSTDWLAKNLDKTIILHIAGGRQHYDSGHLPGARFVAWSEITASRRGIPNELPPVADLQKLFERLGIGDSGRVILYGENSGLFAARAFFTLDYLGHGERAALLDGGLEKWRAEKREISTSASNFKPAAFTPRVRSETVVDLDVMRDLSWTAANLSRPSAVLIDARPAAEYTGETPGEGVARGGHIPGAANVFWMQNVASKENPVMRPAEELRKIYEAAGAGSTAKVVTYCRTGGQASHAYFTAKYLGYGVAMYDGSFFQWSASPDSPVVKGNARK